MIDLISRVLRYLWGIRFWHFFAGGLTCALFGSGVYLVCLKLLEIHYQRANFFGFCAALSLNFFLNKYVAFESREHSAAVYEIPLYALKKLSFYGISVVLLYVGVELLGFDEAWVQPALIPILGLPSFLILRFLVFEKRTSAR